MFLRSTKKGLSGTTERKNKEGAFHFLGLKRSFYFFISYFSSLNPLRKGPL